MAKSANCDGRYGGDVNRKTYRTVTPQIVKRVDILRKQGKTWEEIEKELGVSRFALHQNGITQQFQSSCHKRPKNKYSQDHKEQVIQMILDGKLIKDVSNITGVAQSTIRSWCKK